MTIRVLHVSVQVTLVEDNGDELLPGPASEMQYLTLANAKKFLEDVPAELVRLNTPEEPEKAPKKPTPRRTPVKGSAFKKEGTE